MEDLDVKTWGGVIASITTLIGILYGVWTKKENKKLEQEVEKMKVNESTTVDMSEVVVKAQETARKTVENAYKSQLNQLNDQVNRLERNLDESNVRIERAEQRANKAREHANSATRSAERQVYRLGNVISSIKFNLIILGSHIEQAVDEVNEEQEDLKSKLHQLDSIHSGIVQALRNAEGVIKGEEETVLSPGKLLADISQEFEKS